MTLATSTTKWAVRHSYRDIAGAGFFYLCIDNVGVSWGVVDTDTLLLDTQEDAEALAKSTNRPDTDDNWQAVEVKR